MKVPKICVALVKNYSGDQSRAAVPGRLCCIMAPHFAFECGLQRDRQGIRAVNGHERLLQYRGLLELFETLLVYASSVNYKLHVV